MTSFKDGLGHDISADAFENESPPVKPKLSKAGQKEFDRETEAIRTMAEKERR